MTLQRRIDKLEGMRGAYELHPVVKQWLGMTLTDTERAKLAEPLPPVDETAMSEEERQWLQQ